MASLNQDFTKFAYDSFIIQFTVTSEVSNLGDYHAYWLAGEMGSTEGNSNNAIQASVRYISKSTADFPQEDIGGINFSNGKFFVTLSRDDFNWVDANGEANKTYQHELTLTDSDGSGSVVVSRGNFTINKALFPFSYRD